MKRNARAGGRQVVIIVEGMDWILYHASNPAYKSSRESRDLRYATGQSYNSFLKNSGNANAALWISGLRYLFSPGG